MLSEIWVEEYKLSKLIIVSCVSMCWNSVLTRESSVKNSNISVSVAQSKFFYKNVEQKKCAKMLLNSLFSFTLSDCDKNIKTVPVLPVLPSNV